MAKCAPSTRRGFSVPTSLLIIILLGVITSFFATLSESKLTSIDEKPYTRPQKPHETTTRSISSSTSTLQLVIITHRHGDRTPIYYPSDELDFVTWPLGYGQLTPLGVHQLFELGFAVRNNLPYDFLPANYSSELVHIRASDTDRTLQSAESLMNGKMGIYPPGTGPYYAFEEPIEEQSAALPLAIQPIPIHTVDPDLDYLLRSYDNCKRYEEYLLTDVYTSPEALAKQEEEADLLSLLSDTFDFPVTLSNFYSVYDVLKCEHTHHFYDIHSIDNDTYNQVIELENWIFSQLEFKPNENSYLIGGELVTQIISDINSFINSSNSLTLLKEYSAHDVTVAGLLMTMGVQVDEVPPYAANVITELHYINGEYYLNFTYNFEQISIPNCETSLPPLCPFNSFQSLFADLATKDVPTDCNTKYVSPNNNNNNNNNSTDNGSDNNNDGDSNDIGSTSIYMYIIIGVLSGMTIIIVALSGYFIYRKKQSERMIMLDAQVNNPSSISALPSLPPSHEMKDISIDISNDD